MKTLFAAIISAAAFTAFGASAQPVDGNTVTIHADTPAIQLPATPRVMDAQDFGKFVGSYELANGKTLSLFTRIGGKYAVISGDVPHELVAKTGHSFVAKDRQLAVTIELHDNGDASGEVLMVEPGEKVAGGTAPDRVVRVALH